MYRYDINEIRNTIREYKTIQIFNSGVKDMIDEKLDKSVLETILNPEPKQEALEPKKMVNIQQTLSDIEKDKLYESIINLKHKK